MKLSVRNKRVLYVKTIVETESVQESADFKDKVQREHYVSDIKQWRANGNEQKGDNFL
jgi:hypothetical protein